MNVLPSLIITTVEKGFAFWAFLLSPILYNASKPNNELFFLVPVRRNIVIDAFECKSLLYPNFG